MKFTPFCLTALLFTNLQAQSSLEPLTVTSGEAEDETEFTAADLELLQLNKTKYLLGQAPGFSSVASDAAGFGDFVGVRGTGNTSFFGPAGVGMMIDDVPYGDAYTYPTDFFELSSLQLHRGPQGAHFGRNGAAGMLELHTARPSDVQRSKLSFEYGSDSAFGTRFLTSGPLNDQLAYSFQAYYNEREGYIDNETLGTDVDSRERFGVLGNLYYTPSDDLEIRFRMMYEQARDGGPRLTNLPGQVGPFGVGGFLPQSPYQVGSDILGATALDRYQFSFHLTQKHAWGTFKSISSLQQWSLGPNLTDLDFSAIPAAFSSSDISQEQKYWTQEFRFESDSSEALRWQAGAFFSRTESDGEATRVVPSMFGPFTATTSFDSERSNFALYGNLTGDVSDSLSWHVGGRLEHVDSNLNRTKATTFGPVPAFNGEADDWYFSPTLGLSYDVTDQASFFVRSSIGVKPAGFTAFSDNPATASYQDETAWESELGLRFASADDRLSGELRAYYKKIDDYQVNRSVIDSTDYIIRNADEVTSMGLEAELNWRPIEPLNIFATAGISDVEFVQFAFSETDRDGTVIDYDSRGNAVPYIPDYTASLGFRFDFANGVFLSAAARSIGTTFYDSNESAAYRQDSYEVLDAQLGYEADTWSAVFFARNVLDEDYYTFINPQISAGAPADPAAFGVRVSLEF
ncbi:TonB-dependent receptor [Akkermansiaceae bacterium]|nr:TonB-dependent receptor [Akkermansiaceae bacterium]